MSDIIHLLPDSVANQIAAGEVIQRPSSIVKELIENSIDAESSLIQVFITDAGKSCVQIVDNGKGMSEMDARLSFERHATSKISTPSDLFALKTMGFRGEALASIAAVAQVELKTRTEEEELGICVDVEGGRIKSQSVVACPVGANFSVRNIFFNIPARRKFLKSNQTEMGSIMSEFERLALANPSVAFKLYNNNSLLIDLPAGNFRQRIKALFGSKLDEQLMSIEVNTELVSIKGFVGSPNSSKKKCHQFFFVNGRYMRHNYFAKAIQTAFERLIPENEQIPYFVTLEVDPSRIDVNIHPTKTEIKFQDEGAIWQVVLACVREALGKYAAVPLIEFDTKNKPVMPVFGSIDKTQVLSPPQVHINQNFNPFNKERSHQNTRQVESNWERDLDRLFQPRCSELSALTEEKTKLLANSPSLEGFDVDDLSDKYMQLLGRFILLPVKSGLMLVEQHRADVRILYDYYLRQIKNQAGASQGILFPQTIHFSPTEKVYLEKILQPLTDIGFDLTQQTNGEYEVRGIPSGTEGLDISDLLLNIVQELKQGNIEAINEIHHHVALTLASKSAIPIGEALSNEEMGNLMQRLFACECPNYGPDGAAILAIIQSEKILSIFS